MPLTLLSFPSLTLSTPRKMETRTGGKLSAAIISPTESSTTLPFTNRAIGKASGKSSTTLISNTPNTRKRTPKKLSTKKQKFNENNDIMGLINEELIINFADSTPIASEISNINFHPSWTQKAQILEIPWSQLGAAIGLGRTRAFLPRSKIPLIQQVWIKVLSDSAADPHNEIKTKKVFLLSIVTSFEIKGESIRGNIQKICQNILKDDWTLQKPQNFSGRYKPTYTKKPRKTKSMDKPAEDHKQDIISKRSETFCYKGEDGKAFKALMGTGDAVIASLDVLEYLRASHFERIYHPDNDFSNIAIAPSIWDLTPDETRAII